MEITAIMIVFKKKDILLRSYFFHADEYLHWIVMLADSGTDFFRLVALWISLVVLVKHVLDDLIVYVCAYTYTNTLMVESFFMC